MASLKPMSSYRKIRIQEIIRKHIDLYRITGIIFAKVSQGFGGDEVGKIMDLFCYSE